MPPPEMQNAEHPEFLRIQCISKCYRKRPVLDWVSLSVGAGCFAALVGPSGSGKTTLLKIVNRLIAADSGSVHVAGRDIQTIPLTELRRSIGYVFQGIGLFPHMSVAENIAIVPRLLGVGAEERRRRVRDLLALVDLPPEFADRFPSELSGGQAQRVGFARALAGRPSLILMDEPFGALDPVTRDELGRAYRELHDRLGLTTIMVTHDLTEALLLADRIVVLIGGRIRADAPPAQLLRDTSDPAIQRMLEVPRRQAARLAHLDRRG